MADHVEVLREMFAECANDRRMKEAYALEAAIRALSPAVVSVADIGLCNWAASILSDHEQFNSRANDASAAIRRLIAALQEQRND